MKLEDNFVQFHQIFLEITELSIWLGNVKGEQWHWNWCLFICSGIPLRHNNQIYLCTLECFRDLHIKSISALQSTSETNTTSLFMHSVYSCQSKFCYVYQRIVFPPPLNDINVPTEMFKVSIMNMKDDISMEWYGGKQKENWLKEGARSFRWKSSWCPHNCIVQSDAVFWSSDVHLCWHNISKFWGNARL